MQTFIRRLARGTAFAVVYGAGLAFATFAVLVLLVCIATLTGMSAEAAFAVFGG